MQALCKALAFSKSSLRPEHRRRKPWDISPKMAAPKQCERGRRWTWHRFCVFSAHERPQGRKLRDEKRGKKWTARNESLKFHLYINDSCFHSSQYGKYTNQYKQMKYKNQYINLVQALGSPAPGMQNKLASGSPVSHRRVTLRQMSESQLLGGFNPVQKN